MEHIIKHITQINKGILPNFSTPEIDALTKEYPCFSSLYVLKTINLKNNSSQDIFNDELPHVALKIQDRAKLYDLIHQNYFKQETDEDILDKETEQILNSAEQLKNEPVIESPKIITENEADEKVSKKRNVAAIDKKNVVEKKEKAKKTVKPKTKKSAAKELIKEKIEPEIAVPTSFVEWLKTKKSASTQTENPTKSVKPKEQVPIDATLAHEAMIYQESKKTSYKLEDFLVEQINKKQQQKAVKKEHKVLGISETYAKILENQENFEKAIEVYKELSIKYPKKSATFASRIKNLKNKL